MGITNWDTIVVMGEEGIAKVHGLNKFDMDDIEAVFEALKNPPGEVISNKLVSKVP